MEDIGEGWLSEKINGGSVDTGRVSQGRRYRYYVVETTPVARSTETGSEAGRQLAEKEERSMPVFDDMEETTVEIAVWTTAGRGVE